MGVTIDSIELEIQSDSTNASKGINDFIKSLETLKQAGKLTSVTKNLNSLSSAIKGFSDASKASSALGTLATAIEKLRNAGSIASQAKNLERLQSSLRSLEAINMGSVGSKIKELANSLSPLSQVKAGGFTSLIKSLGQIDAVTKSLDVKTLAEFAAKVKFLTKELGPLADKMATVKTGFAAINTQARKASDGVKELGDGVNTTTLNMSSMINIVKTAVDAIVNLIQGFADLTAEAIEWDGIAARFGRGFGDQAQETYEWIQRLNKEMGINIQQFMKYSSIYATMLTGFGVANEDATKMALGYTELTYDIWAGYNDIYKTFDEASEAVKSAIAGEVEPIRRAGFTIVESQLEQTAAAHGLEISLYNATEAQKSYLRYLTLVDQAHSQSLIGAYAKELNTAEGLTRTLAQQMKSLTQAFGSLFLPILVRILPWFQAFVELLTEAVYWLAELFGVEIQPVDWSGVVGGAGALDSVKDSADGATGAIDDATKAAKELKNATLGIDELNVISPSSSAAGGAGSAGGAGGGASGFEGIDIDSLWDESIFDSVQSQVGKIKSMIRDALDDITAVVSGFALAIGTILVVTGANIPVGLGLMAIGAVGLVSVITENWNTMSEQLAKTLTTITSALGGFLLAIGAVLAFGGVNVPLGVALMAAGAVSLATAATINWKFLEGNMKNALANLTSIVGGGLLALGALFAFTGVSVPFGIALMVAGAVSLATAVALNWDSLSEPIRKAIGTIESIVGGAFLALGAILAFSGGNIPLGIGMMAIGAVSLASAAVLNWDSLTGDLKNTISTITALVSGALLGVGAILAFTGVALPIGIALIAAGAVGLAASAAVNWSSVTQSITSVLKEIGIIGGASLLALGLLLALTGVSLPLGIGLIVAGAGGLASGVALNWNLIPGKWKEFVSWASQAWSSFSSWASQAWSSFSSWASQAWADFVAWLPQAWSKVTSWASQAWSSFSSWISQIWADFVAWLPQAWSKVTSWVSQVWSDFTSWLASVPEKLEGWGYDIGYALGTAWKAITKWWDDSVVPFFESIGKFFSDWFNETIKPFFTGPFLKFFEEDIPKFFTKTIPDWWSGVKEWGAGLWEAITKWWNETIKPFFTGPFVKFFKEDIPKFFTETIPDWWSGVEEWGAGLWEAGKEIVNGLWEGIKKGWEESSLKKFIDGFVQGWKDALGIHSPSTVFAEIGGYLIDGLFEGLSDIASKVKEWVGGFVKKVKESFGIFASGGDSATLKDIGSNLLDSLIKGISDIGTKIKTWCEDFIKKVKEFFGIHSPSTVFSDIGGYLLDGLFEGLADFGNRVKLWADDLLEKVKEFFGINSPSTLMRDEIGKHLMSGITSGMGVNAIRDKLSSAWSSTMKWWDGKKSSLKSYTPSIGSVKDKLSSSWTTAKKWWDGKKGTLKSYTPSIGSIYDKLSERWKNARDWWNKKKGSMSYTPSIGSITDKLKNAWNSAKKWWDKNVKLKIPSMSFKVTYSTPSSKTMKAVMKALDLPGWPKLSFAANGGMFDQGSLVWAGERGPEVVANAGGGKTGVMNVQQMYDAMYEAVYAATIAANRSSGSQGGVTKLYIDGREITSVVEKRQNERGASIMGNEVYSY